MISLYLDIRVPLGTSTTSRLPVKVWVYGGSDQADGISDPLYNGCKLAMAGTIVVSLTYRFGPLGFLTLDSAGIGGDFGIQDILLGLQWVQENIASIWRGPGKVSVHIRCERYNHAYLVLDSGTFVRSICRRQGYFHHQYTTTSTYFCSRRLSWGLGGGQDAPLRSAANAISQKYASSLNCSVADLSRDRSNQNSSKK